MIIEITTRCTMGCSHCMLDCKPTGQDMSPETFQKVFSWIQSLKTHNLVILISGGEPTLHPEWVEYSKKFINNSYITCLLSNGLCLDDHETFKQVRRMKQKGLMIQITNDLRYYPQKINWEKIRELGLKVEQNIRMLDISSGRAKTNHLISNSIKEFPDCVNYILWSKEVDSLAQLLTLAISLQKMCLPRISYDGKIYFGEKLCCTPVGTVDDTPTTIFNNLKQSDCCNNCGLYGEDFARRLLASGKLKGVLPNQNPIKIMG